MDLKECQIGSREQQVVLETLARATARPNCRFLEVGSWCGDSTLVLGRVAQQVGGHVFCVDWWKGSMGTELADIASAEDVFAAFWRRMKQAGLEDVIVPIRAPSALAAQVLAAGAFDLAFLDADHSYDGIAQDIRLYAPLVRRDGGILCGHDCEGRISDYDMEFLEAGKQVDYYESVHCGVVLAVGLAFPNAAVDHAVWSVQAQRGGGWAPTNLAFPGIKHRRQPVAPPIGYSMSLNLFRYGRRVYAVPNLRNGVDVAEAAESNCEVFLSAPSAKELEALIGEPLSVGEPPRLAQEQYCGYNIIYCQGGWYGLDVDEGPFEMTKVRQQQYRRLITGATLEEVKTAVRRRWRVYHRLIRFAQRLVRYARRRVQR